MNCINRVKRTLVLERGYSFNLHYLSYREKLTTKIIQCWYFVYYFHKPKKHFNGYKITKKKRLCTQIWVNLNFSPYGALFYLLALLLFFLTETHTDNLYEHYKKNFKLTNYLNCKLWYELNQDIYSILNQTYNLKSYSNGELISNKYLLIFIFLMKQAGKSIFYVNIKEHT